MVDREYNTPNYRFRIPLDSDDCCSEIKEIVEGKNLGTWSARKRNLLYITLVKSPRVDVFCPDGDTSSEPLKMSTFSHIEEDVNYLSARLFDKSLVGRITYVTMQPIMHNEFVMTMEVSESETTNITSEVIEYLAGLLSWKKKTKLIQREIVIAQNMGIDNSSKI